MALTAAQRFVILCPEYAAHASKDGYLEMAEELTSPASTCGWDEGKRAQAVALRAAHMMSLLLSPERAGGTAGPISQKREGDLAVSFGGSGSGSASSDLDQTSYGKQLQALIKGTWVLLGTTGDDCVLDD